MDKKIMTLIDDNNISHEYEIVSTFFMTETNKHYIIYKDDKGIYAAIFNPNDDSVFEDIKSDEEWSYIEDVIKEIKKNEE